VSCRRSCWKWKSTYFCLLENFVQIENVLKKRVAQRNDVQDDDGEDDGDDDANKSLLC